MFGIAAVLVCFSIMAGRKMGRKKTGPPATRRPIAILVTIILCTSIWSNSRVLVHSIASIFIVFSVYSKVLASCGKLICWWKLTLYLVNVSLQISCFQTNILCKWWFNIYRLWNVACSLDNVSYRWVAQFNYWFHHITCKIFNWDEFYIVTICLTEMSCTL